MHSIRWFRFDRRDLRCIINVVIYSLRARSCNYRESVCENASKKKNRKREGKSQEIA